MKIKKGNYRHFKGKNYKVFGVAKHSETLEEFVVYQALYGKKQFWIRSADMFAEKVYVNGKKIPRFKFLSVEQSDGKK